MRRGEMGVRGGLLGPDRDEEFVEIDAGTAEPGTEDGDVGGELQRIDHV